jgi:hypothetical protein
MTRLLSYLRKSALVGTLCATALSLAGCYAGTGYAVGGDYDDLPPDFVVTTEPYYFEGRPVYWYHDHWHYRDGNHWRYYRSEPAPLRQYRSQPRLQRPAPRVYERPSPSRPPAARGAPPGGGGRPAPSRPPPARGGAPRGDGGDHRMPRR